MSTVVTERPQVRATWIFAHALCFLLDREELGGGVMPGVSDLPGKRFLILQGGTRSSKTYSACQAIAEYVRYREAEVVSIVRKTGPALTRSVLRDLEEVMAAQRLASRCDRNKTEGTFTHRRTQSIIECFAADQAQKLRGSKRDVLYVNEANELSLEEFRQLNMRTTRKVILDFNPSMQRSWIWDLFEDTPEYAADSAWRFSTYKDNPFLSESTIREIERYQETDPYYWTVYGLGQRGASPAAIFPETHVSERLPGAGVLGLDFGYNDPMVLVRVARQDREGRPEMHIDELLHESYLTTDDLIGRLPAMGVRKGGDIMYCDAAEPDRIEALRRAGYDARRADKSRGSVRAGIDFLKQHRLCFTSRSGTSRDEFRDYRWKVAADGTVTDEPSGVNDHAPDAVRYAAFSHWAKPRGITGAGQFIF